MNPISSCPRCPVLTVQLLFSLQQTEHTPHPTKAARHIKDDRAHSQNCGAVWPLPVNACIQAHFLHGRKHLRWYCSGHIRWRRGPRLSTRLCVSFNGYWQAIRELTTAQWSGRWSCYRKYRPCRRQHHGSLLQDWRLQSR